MPSIKAFETLRERFRLERQNSNERFEQIALQLDLIEARLDKIENPKQSHRGGIGGPKRSPTPVPDRPKVMEAAGVGTDPR